MTDAEREIERTNHEFNVELLCIGYSKEILIHKLKKKHEGIAEDGPNKLDNEFWNNTTVDELQEAILRYNEEHYKQIRDAITENKIKYEIKLGSLGESKHFHDDGEI